MMQSSLGDDENTDLSGLVETMVDSDDEEGYVESPDVSSPPVPTSLSRQLHYGKLVSQPKFLGYWGILLPY